MPISLHQLNYYVSQAKAHPGVTVRNCELSLDIYRNLYPGDFAPGVAFSAQVEDQAGVHNVWIYYTVYANRVQMGFKRGDFFMERQFEGQGAMRAGLCNSLAAGLVNQAETARKLRQLIGKFPPSAQCDFYLNWRKHGTLCPHVESVLAHLRDQVPDFVKQMENAYRNAYTLLEAAA